MVAALPLALYALVRRSGRLATYALALAVLATLLTGLVIGSRRHQRRQFGVLP
ncbi:MAG TPA: hypothetical protein VLA70_07170 [Nocardioides sp.]|nr:hypothetical protein [Nocardioides sp.]